MTVVAAKSCVSKSTDEYDVVGGNPAKFIKDRVVK
jgi:acetyltransferase-like isoleucine patch superfamily enzyme